MTIKNAKTILLGSDTHGAGLTGAAGSLTGSAGTDTHSAGLSGTVVVANESAIGSAGLGGTTNTGRRPKGTQVNASNNIRTLASINVTAGEKVLVTYFQHSGVGQSAIGGMNIQRDGTNILGFTGVGSGDANGFSIGLSQILDDPGAGNYVYRAQNTSASNWVYSAVYLIAQIIKATDTHAGSLSGSAGTDTHGVGSDTHAGSLTGSNTQTTRSKGAIRN